jgi:hypothetical protein
VASAALIESDTSKVRRRPGQRGKDVSGCEVADILRWYRQGLTQEQIAAKFEPPKSQSTISDIVRRYDPDRTAEAKAILRGGSADMALNIVRKGRPQDQVQALKGLGVLEEQQQSGLTVIVGAGADVKIGILLSPSSHQLESESSQNP